MPQYFKILNALVFLNFLQSPLFSQQKEVSKLDSLDISAVVYLDSFVVTATKAGFNIDDFVILVREDESFIHAFHNLRFLTYKSTNEFNFKNKKNISKVTYVNLIEQEATGNCRKSKIIEEESQGKFYKTKKKKEYNYYTAKMHDRLFYAPNGSCTDPDPRIEPTNDSKIEKYVSELKKLIFKPGEKAQVPIIGSKTEIFTKKMAQYYDYSIKSAMHKSNREAYVFEVKVKDGYREKKQDKTVIKYLKTYFDKENFQVLGRNYHLAYHSVLYQFDVNMEIELGKFNEKYVPINIKYNGYWNVPFMKKENCTFHLEFYNFQSAK